MHGRALVLCIFEFENLRTSTHGRVPPVLTTRELHARVGIASTYHDAALVDGNLAAFCPPTCGPRYAAQSLKLDGHIWYTEKHGCMAHGDRGAGQS